MDTEPPTAIPGSAAAHGVGVGGYVGGAGGNIMLLQNERQVVRKAGRQAIRQFLEQHNCFSVLRASGKVVVFDTRIPIQLAFYALVEHDMQSAPLWDPVQCQFVGLLTVTDFIDILRFYRQTGKDVGDLGFKSIEDVLHEAVQAQFVAARQFWGADSSCTLEQACQQLLQTGQDFLPIVFAEDMRVLACITYTNMLEHLVTHFREQRRLFDDSITDLGIGTYGNNLVTVTPNQTLAEALELMHQHSLSALPVIDPANENRIVGVYSRSDITFLTKATDAEDAVRNLALPLSDILAQGRQDVTTPDALRTCTPGHTLQAIFESFAQLRFHRLYVVDAKDNLLGVVSAKDLVAYFLQNNDL